MAVIQEPWSSLIHTVWQSLQQICIILLTHTLVYATISELHKTIKIPCTAINNSGVMHSSLAYAAFSSVMNYLKVKICLAYALRLESGENCSAGVKQYISPSCESSLISAKRKKNENVHVREYHIKQKSQASWSRTQCKWTIWGPSHPVEEQRSWRTSESLCVCFWKQDYD